MAPKLSPLEVPSQDTTATPGDLEAGTAQAASTSPTATQQGLSPDVSSRPAPARAYSLGISIPSFLRPSSTQQSPNALPPPATAPGTNGPASPQSPTTPTAQRSRAHTVSVSIQPSRARAGSDAARRGSVTGNSAQRARRGSLLGRGSQDRNSGERRRSVSRGDTPEPVRFDMQDGEDQHGLHDEVVGMLDCIDPQVSTVNHLQNMSNTLVFPHFPALWNRRPEVVLSQTPSDESIKPLTAPDEEERIADFTPPSTARRRAGTTRSRASTVSRLFPPTPSTSTSSNNAYPFPPPNTASGFAPIPEGSPPVTPGLDADRPRPLSPNQIAEGNELEEDVEELEKDHDLDKHVRHVLTRTSKKEKAKQMLKGLWIYVRTPMGFVVAIYGFLVVFWGAAIVLFLLGWIPTNSKNTQDIWIEISSQVVNGLFTVTGVGLIPWRAMDTYRMYVIWRLKRKVTSRRKEKGLDPIPDPNDIPDPSEQKDYVSVLSEYEQAHLLYQQEEFAKSQTWYKPHATATHKAFPIGWALWNTLLMDGNSFFQCILCGCMWGMNRHKRPAWTTGSLIPLSFLCGIGAAVLIWQGSVRTKKSISVEDKLRSALGVSLAIGGVPQTKDGTIITGHNRAPTPPTPDSSHSTSAETDEKKPFGEVKEATTNGARRESGEDTGRSGKRRTTVTFGSVPDKTDTGRNRGSTVAAPASSPRPVLEPLGPVISGDGQAEESWGTGGMELREIASQPRVAEEHWP